MKNYSGIFCFAALLMAGHARADLIGSPSNLSDFTNYANWYVGCDYEYLCDSYFETSTYVYSFLEPTSIQYDNFLNANALSGTYFAYGEVDAYSQTDQAYDLPLDYIVYNNGGAPAPVAFSFETDYDSIVPTTVSSLGTTIYSYSAFAANVSAYDLQGNLLGTTTFSSTENDNEEFGYVYQPTYSAFVGIADYSSNDIGSVVISTTASDSSSDIFGFGLVGVTYTPEPGTLAMMSLATSALWLWRKRFRPVHRDV